MLYGIFYRMKGNKNNTKTRLEHFTMKNTTESGVFDFISHLTTEVGLYFLLTIHHIVGFYPHNIGLKLEQHLQLVS